MPEKLIRKDLRRRFNPVGWTLVLYYILMNVAVTGVVFLDMFIQIFLQIANGADMNTLDEAQLMNSAMNNAWGYLLAAAIGLFIVLCWKKPRFFREQIFARGKPMTVGAFAQIVCVFLGVQLLVSLLNYVLELILNLMGLSMMAALESASGVSDSLSMFIYASLCAPITEELLFRGLIQRTLQPYGKKFAIFCSALLFGLFHGNLAQIPFAFLVGLVLGYVTAEYNIIWAMVLHMINNLVLADMLTRLTSWLPGALSEAVTGLVIIAFGIAAVIVLIVNHRKIGAYLRQERMHKLCLQAFFSQAGVIVLAVMMLLNAMLLILPY